MFNKEKAQKINQDVEKAIQDVLKKHNVALTNNGGNYSDSSVTLKFTFTAKDMKTRQKSFTTEAQILNLPPDIVGQKFESNGRTHTISELRLRNRKYPVITEANDGKSYKFETATIKRLLQFKAHLYQTGGCDYTIGCGHIVVDLEATTFPEAEKELTEEYTDELALEGATLFEVKTTFEVPVNQIYEEEKAFQESELFNQQQE